MKKIVGLMLMAECLMAFTAWGRSFSIDLRALAAKAGGHIYAKVKAAASTPDRADGMLRKVNLDAGAANVGEVAIGDELSFTLFDDVTVTLSLKTKMPSPLGGDVFLAEASGYEGIKNAVVLRTADGLTIDVQDYRNRKVYKVISTATGVVVQELEAKGGKCGCDALEPPNMTDKTSTKLYKAKKVATVKESESEETCVDILVAYDMNAATWANANGGGVTNFAQMAVQKMNTVLVNSGLDWSFRFRLVGIEQVTTSSSNLDFTLNAAKAGDGDWAPIKTKRDEVGADIVTVLIDTGTDEGTAGLGFSLKTEDFTSFSESAYNVCAIRSVAQSHTMTHEVGHNMGCGHSDLQETQPGPQLYSYSAGYYFSADGEKYHTVMAYGTEGPGGIEVPYFSSPYYTYKDVAVGDDSHDNRRTLQNTYEAVSKWREDKGIDIGGGDDVPVEPIEWLTSHDEVFTKAKAEGKKIFLICGRDTCMNTMGTRNYSCEDPSVKRHLLKNYVCWYNVIDTQYEEAEKYFEGYDVGMTLPSIAIIDAEKDETLAAEGGYHTVTDLRIMLGRVAKEVAFSPESESRFRNSVEVALTAAPGAAIYYTLDGTDPMVGTSICYDKPITLTETTTIRAITFADGVWGLPIDAEFAKSRTEECGGYQWTADVVAGSCVIVSVTPEPSGDIEIPAKIEGLDVIGFDGEVFKGKMSLSAISIPGSIREITDNAFESCEKLKAVTIGNGVERIGHYAFGWTGLETVDIPASVTNIGIRAFTGCYDMTAITVDPANGYYFSQDGFMYDKTQKHLLYCPGSLGYVEIPQGVTHIGVGAFSDSNIERVVFPKSVVEIGESAFVWCGQLKAVAIPESVTNIGYSAFSYCWAPLADAYLPKSLEDDYIKDDSFWIGWVGVEVAMHYYSGTLKQFSVHFDANGGELDTPDQTLEIAENNIVMPTTLPVPLKWNHAFLGWFTAIDGGSQVTMDSGVPDGMTLYAHWKKQTYEWSYKENSDGGITITGCAPASGLIIIPSEIDSKQVVAIGDDAFLYSLDLKGIWISNGITNIGDQAFGQCYALEKIIMPASLASIERNAFFDCGGLKEFDMDEGNMHFSVLNSLLCTKDGREIIVGAGGLVEVTIPESVVKIGDDAFYGCSLNSIVIPGNVKEIGDSAFSNSESLEEVIFEEGVEIIGTYAFWNNNKITSLKFPASIRQIGSRAFGACHELLSVEYMGNANAIEMAVDAFHETPYNDTLPFELIVQDGAVIGFHGTIPEDLVLADYATDISEVPGWGCFCNIGRLKSIVFPSSVKGIGNGAFAYDNLTNVTLSVGLEWIGAQAFMSCSKLASITIPYTVTELDNLAFQGCTALAEIHMPLSLKESFETITFTSCDARIIWDYEPHWTVILDVNGGEQLEDSEKTVFEGRTIGALPAPTKPGFTFSGWFSEADGGSQVPEETTITTNMTLYAHWTKIVEPEPEPEPEPTPDPVTPEPVTPEPVTPEPEPTPAPVTPDPTPTPDPVTPEPVVEEETYGGMVENVEFTKAQAVLGALYDAKGNLAGTVELKFGKINKKQVVKVSGSATIIVDGKAKKITAKAVNVTVGATKRVPPTTLAFKAPIGNMTFAMDADGVFTLKSDKYEMVGMRTRQSASLPVSVGGAMPNGTVHFNVDMDSVPDFGKDGWLLKEALPVDEPIKVSGGKWSFGKAASLKYAKNKATGSYELIGRNDTSKPNVSGLKLTYTAKTGLFKGSFKLYATNEATTPSGKAPKLKKYTVNVIGFVVDGKGYGEATLKKPAGAWVVTVQ